MNLKLIIAYDGTRYNGFQKQTLHPERTIQGKLEHVLSRLFDKPIVLIASGRTDSGVHAKGQVCNFQVETELTPEEIANYLSTYLPTDISVLQITTASLRFHSRYNAVKKRYCYTIDNHLFANPFTLRYAYHLKEPLDVTSMKEASKCLLGTHDFKSFTSLKSKKKSTVRTLYSIDFIEEDGLLKIYYEGDGFLQHMVRILTGTLIEVGLGQRDPLSLVSLLEQKVRADAGMTAPPHGLTLEKVYYD
ncbi:tRNA pseudouridine(38-40) synthase TruA [Sporanaerobium hydrogeniformans]|uniref:tRNA pseudouridine(38-40) synthase TruA n=1 Tax=Sporanaerobium hydrogeniformans TaxID=3072179 RepID=UPI002FE6B277